ncbi:ribosomal subunit 39S-domain-containing protein [Hypoxylon fuscum]|nr:ribosomal subunit 39S-domain-containing protein [Hypoxylon fuscum]
MRRVSRIRGLPASTSRSPIAPLVGQCPPASSYIVSASRRRPALRRPVSARLYSSSRPRSQGLSRDDQESLEAVDDQPQQAYIPPPQRSYAERLDQVSDPNYVPAMTADGLETVGGVGRWWDKPDHWSNDFASFRPSEKVVDPALLEASVRRAVVEAFALRQAGRQDELVSTWPSGTVEELRRIVQVGIGVAEDGVVSLNGNVDDVIESLNWNDETPSASLQPSAEEAQKYKETWDQGWKTISLSEPRIKFAVTKRIFQLTGQLVPDHQLSSIADVGSLLRAVQKPPKPKTLTQEIQEHRQDLVQLPNVSVAAKRITRGDREKAVGRFKLVEEELKKRDLPLEGHGFTRKNRELSRLKGGI